MKQKKEDDKAQKENNNKMLQTAALKVLAPLVCMKEPGEKMSKESGTCENLE